MEDLIKRLQEASEGSLDLDVEIAAYLSPDTETVYGFTQKVWLGEQPRYTTSIDAALTLFDEEERFEILFLAMCELYTTDRDASRVALEICSMRIGSDKTTAAVDAALRAFDAVREHDDG